MLLEYLTIRQKAVVDLMSKNKSVKGVGSRKSTCRYGVGLPINTVRVIVFCIRHILFLIEVRV